MLETVLRPLPIVLGMAGGCLLRKAGVAGPRDGGFLLRLAFTLFIPALLVTSLATVDITGELAIFPVAGVLAVSTGYLAGVRVPAPIAGAVATFGSAAPMRIFLALGILFEPPDKGLRRAALIVAVRLVTGLAVAALIVLVLGLTGVDRMIVLLLGVAPVAFNSVIFASLENLDVRLALTALSLSLVASLILAVVVTLVTT
ncbi:hypothetical protein HC028_26035 [Planosporangium flavigriseum]|uniref:AEC family transporter n=1 Tax=Planosporangium flavigriseum TaxID=373681 RepID=A0A8J3PPK7_9ACTN|nr:hypothetical protein [Planosporangium flavigriseum]NJC67939.1 hypothetical protein [Planosporangium flavigriseum]GIG76474.1 hypothetical protein Pfl04_48780 [Planosporangium flavigriseum]